MSISRIDLSKYEVISFDIFDTLLVRAVSKPEDVFLLLGYNCKDMIKESPEDFVRLRIKAAANASAEKENGECTIADIYERLSGYDAYEKELLMNEELNIERLVLKKNANVYKFYNRCIEEKKTIIAISDMYLPSAFLSEVLKENGYNGISEIFVSCEYKANKSSAELFNVVKTKLGKIKYLHLGDSWRSDFINPKRIGWDAVHVKKRTADKSGLPQAVSSGFIHNYNGDYYSRIGYEVLGPVLFEFNKWLKKELEKRNTQTALFLSREGKIIQNAHEIMFPEHDYNSVYFHISRKAVNTAALWMHPEFETLDRYIENTHAFSLRTFLKRLGLLDQTAFEDCGLNLDKEYLSSRFWKDEGIKVFYNSKIKPVAFENSKEQYRLFLEYFRNATQSDSIALVDIGWIASMQDRMEEIVETSQNKKGILKIDGYYLGSEDCKSAKHGFLYSGCAQTRNKTVVDAGVGLLETLFLANEGTTLAYKEGEHGVMPIIDKKENRDRKTKEQIDAIHKGALEYISDMMKFRIMYESASDPVYCIRGFEDLCLSPTKDDLAQLGALYFNDTGEMPLIDSKGVAHYVMHPHEIKRDYHRAPWKIGFLKENISSAIGWKRIYMFAKSKMG